MEQFLRVLFISMLLGISPFRSAFSYTPPAAGAALEGVFNVSDMGGATYTIPIKVPEGIGGLQPSLALVYNSQAGNGIMGMGWSLSGLSAITRVRNNIYNDRKVQGVKLDLSDHYALDGNRLIAPDNDNPELYLALRTEIETFSDITMNGVLGESPESFTVVDQNGLTYEYGKSARTRATVAGHVEPYMWLLEEVTDLNGNVVTYYYHMEYDDVPTLDKIEYNGNTYPGSTRVQFNYVFRFDPNFSYLAGGKIGQPHILKSIEIGSYAPVFPILKSRSYDLEYTYNPYAHLISIKERGYDLLNNTEEELYPTTFEYGSTTPDYETTTVSDTGFSVAVNFAVGDYNGDGKSDVIMFTKNYNSAHNIWELYLSTGSTFNLSQTGDLPPTPSDYTENENIINRDYRASFFDFNGDGKEDFVYRSKKTLINQSELNNYNILLSDGNSLSSLLGGAVILPSNNDTLMGGPTFFNTYPMIGDFDGDGKTEILVLKAEHNIASDPANYMIGENYLYPSGDHLLAKQLQGMPFDATRLNEQGGYKTKLFVIDYDGDGKNEILVIWYDNVNSISRAEVFELNVTFDENNKPHIGNPAFKFVKETGYPTVWHSIYIGDFNGDGITDVLTWINTATWEIGYGKGNGLMNDIKPAPALGEGLYTTRRPIVIADYNGDGKSDIFNYIPQYNASDWGPYRPPGIYYSMGNNEFDFEDLNALEPKIAPLDDTYWIGDYTGDGQTDILSLKAWTGTYPLI